ncbi:hypothetical protein V496_08638 [Pseudogymnoascus sp. VKM F-4515 (FW-2607)]|nr:hypothetical protein V496_08638 [Pseudogymnoascus sp. VKM F-4515 (FW-2607)]KFY78292.1 hypothetical protein V498_09135 [Pseudogymnoascus sp. VKM F-4517 (FW-2822)]
MITGKTLPRLLLAFVAGMALVIQSLSSFRLVQQIIEATELMPGNYDSIRDDDLDYDPNFWRRDEANDNGKAGDKKKPVTRRSR